MTVGQVKEDLFLVGSDLGWVLSVAVQWPFFPFSPVEILTRQKRSSGFITSIYISISAMKLKTNKVSERNVSTNEKPQE